MLLNTSLLSVQYCLKCIDVHNVHTKKDLPEVDVQGEQTFGLVDLTHRSHVDVNLNNCRIPIKLWSVHKVMVLIRHSESQA